MIVLSYNSTQQGVGSGRQWSASSVVNGVRRIGEGETPIDAVMALGEVLENEIYRLEQADPAPSPGQDPDQAVADTVAWLTAIPLPHSRACGLHKHKHGLACHNNCPTCHGKEQPDG